MVSWNWPSDFPEDCPPNDALPADGVYYRIVRNMPLDASDFVSVYEQNRRRAESVARRGQRSLCETMGLSVYANRDDAIQTALRYNIGDKIASVLLTADAGLTLYTGDGFNSHHTWWKATGFDATQTVYAVEALE